LLHKDESLLPAVIPNFHEAVSKVNLTAKIAKNYAKGTKINLENQYFALISKCFLTFAAKKKLLLRQPQKKGNDEFWEYVIT
jgi:hypothetical protein